MIELPMVPTQPPARLVTLTIDESQVEVPEGSTVLDACAKLGIELIDVPAEAGEEGGERAELSAVSRSGRGDDGALGAESGADARGRGQFGGEIGPAGQ